MKDKIILWNPQPPESESNPEPEEKTCKKCLEIESECQCHYYAELEAEELKAIKIDKKTRSSDMFRILGQTQIIMNNLY